MRRTTEMNESDAEFTASLLADAEAVSAAREPAAPVELAAPGEADELDASTGVAGGVPAEDFDPSLVMAGGVPALDASKEKEPSPALNLGEDPVEQNRQRILRRKRWEELLQPSYWDNAKALLLKKVEQGGLRTEIGISGDTVIFAVKGAGLSSLLYPPKITFNLGAGTIKASGSGLSPHSLAAAYIECGVAAGYKQMWFDGSPDFLRIASELARANGIELISKSECVAARKLRSLENDEALLSAPAPAKAEPTFDPVDEEMSTRGYR